MQPTFKDLTAASLKVGLLGFGGPAGQVALMHRIFVDEKKWIDEPRFLHALSYCTLLPGPEAQQLATYIGWLLHGVRGGVVAGGLFVIPGAIVVFALSWLYAVHGETPLVGALFYGIKAAVLALVAEALVKVGRRSLKGPVEAVIAVAAFVALAGLSAPFPLVIAAAAIFGAVRGRGEVHPPTEPTAPGAGRRAAKAALVWGTLWLAPLALTFGALGPDHVVTRVGALFAGLAAVSFGGAYALLAFLQQQAVEVQGWLTAAQMIDGLGLAETTPGPLVLVNEFVGFMAGWKTGGLAMASATALMALWQTFAPSYLFIFAGAPYAEALRGSGLARGALEAIMAAVLGVIASLAFWFGLHVLVPEPGRFDAVAALLAATAAVALIRFKANVLVVISGCALAGLAIQAL